MTCSRSADRPVSARLLRCHVRGRTVWRGRECWSGRVIKKEHYCQFIESLIECELIDWLMINWSIQLELTHVTFQLHLSSRKCLCCAQWSSLIGQLLGILYHSDERWRKRLNVDEEIVSATKKIWSVWSFNRSIFWSVPEPPGLS